MAANLGNCMRSGASVLVCAVLGVTLAACASLDVETQYQPPQDEAITNDVIVDKPFEPAWDAFVRQLSQSFFIVNTISKESRLINISVPGPRARDFFDCGRLSSTVNGDLWTFDPARSAEYSHSGFRDQTVIHHTVTAEGTRMNIFVAPKGSGTLFEVNSTYSLHMRQTGQTDVHNLLGQVIDRDYLPTSDAYFNFTTKSYDEQAFAGAMLVCKSTGKWERQILDLARSS